MYARAAAADDSTVFQNFDGLIISQYNQGHADEARRTRAAFHRKLPALAEAAMMDGFVQYADGQWDSAAATARRLGSGAQSASYLRRFGDNLLMSVQAVQGRLADMAAIAARREQIEAQGGDSGMALDYVAQRALAEVLLQGRADAAGRLLDSALRRYPLEGIDPANRPWGALIQGNAVAGRAAQARALLERWTHDVPSVRRGPSYGVARGFVLTAEQKPSEARTAFQVAADSTGCNACLEPWIARTWEA